MSFAEPQRVREYAVSVYSSFTVLINSFNPLKTLHRDSPRLPHSTQKTEEVGSPSFVSGGTGDLCSLGSRLTSLVSDTLPNRIS